MNFTDATLVLAQGPYPYGGGYAVIFLFFLAIAICVAVFVMCWMRRESPQPSPEKTPLYSSKRITGFLFGCLLVGVTALVIDVVAGELEFSQRVDVADDGTVTGGGFVRSEAWYRFGRTVYVLSMLGFIVGGVTIGVRAQAQLWRNGVSWGMVIAGVWALFVG